MFDVGFPELLVVSIVTLLILGPERLPEVLRTLGRWIGAARRSFTSLKNEIEREIGADELRRELHNSQILEQTREAQASLRAVGDDIEESLSSARRESLAAFEKSKAELTSAAEATADANPEAPAAIEHDDGSATTEESRAPKGADETSSNP